jgi:hypothetical protein
MSAMMTHPEIEGASASAELTTTSEELSPSNQGVFFEKNHSIESADIDRAPDLLRASVRAELYGVLSALRDDMFERNAILLTNATINDHSTIHQDRDAYMVQRLFDVFPDKLAAEFKEPAVVASMVHDREYIPAVRAYALQQLVRIRESFQQAQVIHRFADMQAVYGELVRSREQWTIFLAKLERLENTSMNALIDPWSDSSFPKQIGKKELDPHAELGEKMIRTWYEEPDYDAAFGAWNEQQKEVGALTIRDHSNGSEYNPFATPLEAQVLRLADKLDNTYRRVPDSMLNAESLRDANNCHRYVPVAIRSLALDIDRDKQIFTVDYCVDVTEVEQRMRMHKPDFVYSQDLFLQDFERAYGQKSMRIAAEVVDKLFAKKGEFYSDNATFQVRFTFPDSHQHIIAYKRLAASPVYE